MSAAGQLVHAINASVHFKTRRMQRARLFESGHRKVAARAFNLQPVVRELRQAQAFEISQPAVQHAGAFGTHLLDGDMRGAFDHC